MCISDGVYALQSLPETNLDAFQIEAVSDSETETETEHTDTDPDPDPDPDTPDPDPDPHTPNASLTMDTATS